jgi:hypothetical protein
MIYTAPLTSPYTFKGGQWYWLAALADTEINSFQIASTARASQGQYVARTYALGFPNWTAVEGAQGGRVVAAYP